MQNIKGFRRLKVLFVLVILMLGGLQVINAQDPGTMLADSGFRPMENGFKFENYSEGYENLTAIELQRMFGDVACDTQKAKASGCKLSPTAQMWMDSTNESMLGGHCEGMAALSLLFYTNTEAASNFGADQTNALDLDGNDLLQREIAYWWATQATSPTNANFVKGTPSEIVDTLIKSMNEGGDTYTVGIYMRDGTGGHAITPYAVTDQGEGINWIMVYDNNWPGDERHIEVNRNDDTWSYNAATNPNEPESLYEGDATTGTLDLTPTSPRLETQECAFCGDADYSEQGYTSVVVSGKGAKASITDDKGNITGFDKDNFVNNIPGAIIRQTKNYLSSQKPAIIDIPNGSRFRVAVSAGAKTPEGELGSIILIRKGAITKVGNIKFDSNENFLDVEDAAIKYTSGDGGEAPIIEQGVTLEGNDYMYVVRGHSDMSDDGTLDFSFDPATGGFKVTGSDDNEYSVNVDRVDEDGNHDVFQTDNLQLGAGDNADLNPSEWQDNGEITGDITGSDGAEISPIDLPDQNLTDGGDTQEPTVEPATDSQATEVGSDTEQPSVEPTTESPATDGGSDGSGDTSSDGG